MLYQLIAILLIIFPVKKLCYYATSEPNLVTNTTHSLARKGIKSKDLSDGELRDMSAQLMTHVRQSHLFPTNTEVSKVCIELF